MSELKVGLSPKDILNKEFKYDTKGYRPQEVDQFLDFIIADYNEFIHFIKRLEKENQELIKENNHLKSDINKLKRDFEQIASIEETGKFSSNNVDLLKRLSNLEKIVYGKNE